MPLKYTDRAASGQRAKPGCSDYLPWQETATFQKAFSDLNLTKFAQLLKKADIVDNRAIDLSGSSIWLPYGIKLRRLYEDFISGKYEENGLAEYQYPSLVPYSIFQPIESLYNFENKLLRIQTRRDVESPDQDTILSPTGEASIYSHWRTHIKEKGLPIRMFRKASYYRPIRRKSGMGIFNSPESTGVFEFHAAYLEQKEIPPEIDRYQIMLSEIFDHLMVPYVWSLRPKWTNNHAVSNGTYGADTILPNGTSMQIGSIYDQGRIFSERYDIYKKVDGQKKYTEQIAGYCSCKALLSQIYTMSFLSNRFLIQPRIAPVRAAVIFKQGDFDENSCKDFVAGLENEPKHRYKLFVLKIADKSKSIMREMNDKGVPLIVVVNGKRSEKDCYQITFYRQDKGEEAKIKLERLDRADFYRHIEDVLSDIETYCMQKCSDYMNEKFMQAYIQDKKNLMSSSSDIRLFPLVCEENQIKEIEGELSGEIIGFVEDDRDAQCILTGKMVRERAIFCRRF